MKTLHTCSRSLKERMIALPLLTPCMFLLLIRILSPWDASCWAQETGSKPPLLTLRYSDIDLTRNDALYDNHLVLCSTGLFHLMRKTQVFPEHKATLTVYEGQLSEAKLAEVRLLLASKDLEALPPFDYSSVLSFISLGNSGMEMASARIYRNGKVQEVGYVVWHGPRTEDSIEGAPPDVQNEQHKAKAIFTSLLQWQKSLHGTRIDNSNATPFGCF